MVREFHHADRFTKSGSNFNHAFRNVMHFLSELLGMEPSAPGVSRTLKEKSVIQITFRIGFTSQKHEIKDD